MNSASPRRLHTCSAGTNYISWTSFMKEKSMQDLWIWTGPRIGRGCRVLVAEAEGESSLPGRRSCRVGRWLRLKPGVACTRSWGDMEIFIGQDPVRTAHHHILAGQPSS